MLPTKADKLGSGPETHRGDRELPPTWCLPASTLTLKSVRFKCVCSAGDSMRPSLSHQHLWCPNSPSFCCSRAAHHGTKWASVPQPSVTSSTQMLGPCRSCGWESLAPPSYSWSLFPSAETVCEALLSLSCVLLCFCGEISR